MKNKNINRKINKETLVECSNCGNISSIEEWDNRTYKLCNNRASKRDFVSMENTKAFMVGSRIYYYCDCCMTWIHASTLKILSKEYMNIGREKVGKVIVAKEKVDNLVTREIAFDNEGNEEEEDE